MKYCGIILKLYHPLVFENHLVSAKIFYACKLLLSLAFFVDLTKEVGTKRLLATQCLKIQFHIGSVKCYVMCRYNTDSFLVGPFFVVQSFMGHC